MKTPLHTIPFAQIEDYPENLDPQKALEGFNYLRRTAQELCATSSNITKKTPSSVEEGNSINGQKRRRLKASGIFRHVRDGHAKGLSISFNDRGNPSAQLVWKGTGQWTASIDGMGLFCDCPDSERDYHLCKHKLALVGLIVDAGNFLDKNPQGPQVFEFNSTLTESLENMHLFVSDLTDLSAKVGQAWDLAKTQKIVGDPLPYYNYLSSLEGLLGHLDRCKQELGGAISGVGKLNKARDEL